MHSFIKISFLAELSFQSHHQLLYITSEIPEVIFHLHFLVYIERFKIMKIIILKTNY